MKTDRFELNGVFLEQTLFDFFAWYCGNLFSNTTRGVLAEYIVALAAGCDTTPRLGDWNDYDLLTPSGIRVEVKSSAYLQSWEQRKLSNIRFSIAPAKHYDESTGKYDPVAERHSDIYVFCVFTCTDRGSANPLNLNQWKFFFVDTETINQRKGPQKTISLSEVRKFGIPELDFDGLKKAFPPHVQPNADRTPTSRQPKTV